MNTGRKLYSISETYRNLYNGLRTIRYMAVFRKNNEICMEFMERIMLAVTQVNACAICSYVHTKMALEAGVSSKKIQNVLAGIFDDTPSDQLTAAIFTQHYADARVNPSKVSWERFAAAYGLSKQKNTWCDSNHDAGQYIWNCRELLY